MYWFKVVATGCNRAAAGDEIFMVAKDVLPAHGIVQSILANENSLDYFRQTDSNIKDMLIKTKPKRFNE